MGGRRSQARALGLNAKGRPPVTTTLYGIRNCDTMKKAWTWLDGRGVAYAFHDYKKEGVDRPRLERWAREVGWERLLNRSGTTFRKLPEADRSNLDEAKAIGLMLAQPSMIKRPVLEADGGLLVGFNPADYARRFGAS
jgi:Spx/MgsR family transcriptional regulator